MILGMDWLSRHQVVVDYRMKRVTLRTPSGEEVTFIDERLNHLSNVISSPLLQERWFERGVKPTRHM